MASNLLHIKDSYYFEVPKFMWASNRESIDGFPDFWVRLDPGYQAWEADLIAHSLEEVLSDAPGVHDLVHQWEHWQHSDHANHGRPLDVFLEMQKDSLEGAFAEWKKEEDSRESHTFTRYLNETNPDYKWFVVPYTGDPIFQRKWEKIKGEATAEGYREGHRWDDATVENYNVALRGKVLIPQPFGELRNMYQKESGFCISRFMVIELVLAMVMVLVFAWLAKRMRSSDRPKGRVWNLLEVLLFIRDEIARPAIGGGHDHDDDHGGHAGEDAHGQAVHAGHGHANPADRFVPLLWTMFFFVLGCNLFGMLPWAGAPTGSFAVTTAMALITLSTVVLGGMKEFGPLGFFANQVPTMDLPLPIAIFVKPMLLAIELLGLGIKHAVLAIRLLANMVAGHLVLLGVMGLAFGAHAATQFEGDAAGWWGLTATIAVVGSTLFSLLELFVAFLQAYIFTFLSALFIGTAVHEH